MPKYESVNGAWPDKVIPVPTAQEAVLGSKKLYRLVMKKGFKGKVKVVTGNSHTWVYYGLMKVNPNRTVHYGGWKGLVHGLSHYCSRKLYPTAKPHSPQHAFIEKTMIEHVVNSGWLSGSLKREPRAEVPVIDIRYQSVIKRIDQWQTKLKRARNALKKLERTKKYYDKKKSA